MLRRYQLNKIVVDTEAGPHRNRTVLFLGSSRGTILKFLIMPNQDNTVTNSNIFLEELEGFNPDKYDGWWMCVWGGGEQDCTGRQAEKQSQEIIKTPACPGKAQLK